MNAGYLITEGLGFFTTLVLKFTAHFSARTLGILPQGFLFKAEALL
jgi:hypothetical protein